jgi:IclR family transcriptional regulator, acetate operon repressor
MEKVAAKTKRSRRARSGQRAREGAGQVQSLVRALALLNSIAESPDDGATLSDLALQVGLPPSTAHRLLTTLEQERYVKFNPEGRQWAIGVQAFVTGCSFTKTRSLAAIARPYMRNLMEESGETTNLAVEDEGEAVYLSQVECRQTMRVFSRPGSRVPLHCSAVGKAILSAVPGKRLSKIMQQRGMPRLTVKTITAPAALRADLDRVRALGYALDDEEHHAGSRCIAAPIFDETGDVIAAVSASGPIVRIDEETIPRLGALVSQTAREISAALGAKTAKGSAAMV